MLFYRIRRTNESLASTAQVHGHVLSWRNNSSIVANMNEPVNDVMDKLTTLTYKLVVIGSFSLVNGLHNWCDFFTIICACVW